MITSIFYNRTVLSLKTAFSAKVDTFAKKCYSKSREITEKYGMRAGTGFFCSWTFTGGLSMKKARSISLLASAVMAFGCFASLAGTGASAVDFKPAVSVISDDVNVGSGKYDDVTYSKNTEGFVKRMYNIVLDREPDATGLKTWTNKLNSKKASASDIINGFFFSDEYKGKNKSSSDMLRDCYKAMLDRYPDAKGAESWGGRLNIGMSIQVVCKGIVGSSEFKSLCKTYGINAGSINLMYAKDENYERTYFVYRLYKNCLGRTPDGTGLENWCKSLKNGKTGSSIAQGFIFSKEYKGKHVTNADFVDMLYRTILGRSPDKTGANSWTSKLDYTNTREYVTNGFLFSDEFKGQCSRAGIKVGDKLATKDNSADWKYNIAVLKAINDKRTSVGLKKIATSQDILENITTTRAKDVLKLWSDELRPDGSTVKDFIDGVLVNKSTSIKSWTLSPVAIMGKFEIEPAEMFDDLWSAEAFGSALRSNDYPIFAISRATNGTGPGHSEAYYAVLMDLKK